MRLLRGKNGKIHPVKLVLMIGAIVAIVVPFCTGPKGLLTLLHLRRDVDQLRQEIATTNRENAAIGDSIKALDTEDPETLEREARNLGMIKPGETVYKVVPAEK